MNKIVSFFDPKYLMAVPVESSFHFLFLTLPAVAVLSPVLLKIFFRFFKKRHGGYEEFDKLWFWGYETIGLIGLFIFFSRDQRLPIFGTRIASYLVIIAMLIFSSFLFFYFRKFTKKEISYYLEKKRKEKYLKR
ncbi:MAG: hypothetical protein PHT36_02865 [Patescibacteria group bacterium]|nr:hypothetical protein [Patescibacteria group bacterium]